MAIILTFAYQHIEKKMDEWQEQNAEMRAEHQAHVINQKLDALKEKENKGLLQDSDYSLYIVRYLETIPIQFIPTATELEMEAVQEAISIKYKNIDVKILRPEYLVAIFLKVFRPKDKEKLIKLLDQAEIDKTLLGDILARHNLDKKFDDFMRRYYG